MAVTGFWPVKGSLKDLINYADNPEKTKEPEKAENDLQAAIRYVENGEKTEQRLYIGGINCTRDHAYEEMTAVQKHFGNRGKVVAYHGVQSFPTGEVTPEEAFAIGKETARAMWGDKYQVLVTVHLNTDNLHCHFVVNPVSFVDGSKYHNKIAEHKRLREVSDRICLEHEKSVLEHSSFYGGEKKAYWIHQKGQKSHRDLVREDVNYCLSVAYNMDSFFRELHALGYSVDTTRMSVKAPGWERAVRLERLGFSRDMIRDRLEKNLMSPDARDNWNSRAFSKVNHFPLEFEMKKLAFSVEHAYDPSTLIVDTLFLLVLVLIRLMSESADVLLSPDLRHEARNVKQYLSDYHFLQAEQIHTLPELEEKITATKEEISALEALRTKADNRRRHHRNDPIGKQAREERAAITQKLKPLREKLKQQERILEKTPGLYQLLQGELTLERDKQHKMKIRQLDR